MGRERHLKPRFQNYRSHPAILMTPSALFYDDSLEPCADNGFVHWSGLFNKHLPFKFIGHDKPEDCNDEVRSFHLDHASATLNLDIARKLLQHG